MSEATNGGAANGEASNSLATLSDAMEMSIVRPEDRGDLMWDPAATKHGYNLARGLAQSALIPQHFRNKPADVFVALTMARRMNEDVFVIMQSMHVINGKAGWSAQYLIARAKRAGVNIRWRVKKLEPAKIGGIANLSVTAYAMLPGEAEPVEVEVTTQQAVDAGWTSNAQYKHSAELMLTYRSATWLVRRYLPEVLLGYHTTDELDDVKAATTAARSAPAVVDAQFEPASASSPTSTPTGGAASTSEAGPPARKSRGAKAEPAPFDLVEPQAEAPVAFDRETGFVKITDYEASLGPVATVEIGRSVGLPITASGEVELEGATDGDLGRYLAALRERELL